MSKLNISRLTNENEDGSPYISGITTFSSTAFLNPPKGNTAQRPEYVKPGMIRFNTDSAHLEYYNGVEWTEVVVANNDLNGGARGVFGGGITPTIVNTIDYITISSTGNALDFGDLFQTRSQSASCSSSTRGLFGGGYTPSTVNTIDFITISSTGNASDFGDLSVARRVIAGCSSSTRGVIGGGYNTIDFITIASTGNAQDFGDLIQVSQAGCSSSTRGIFGGGYVAPTLLNIIQFVTILTTGNATDFGDLTQARSQLTSLSNGHGGL